jgi:hypothetical protein
MNGKCHNGVFHILSRNFRIGAVQGQHFPHVPVGFTVRVIDPDAISRVLGNASSKAHFSAGFYSSARKAEPSETLNDRAFQLIASVSASNSPGAPTSLGSMRFPLSTPFSLIAETAALSHGETVTASNRTRPGQSKQPALARSGRIGSEYER